jgi:uncharacterized protein (DUF1499 family)
MKPDNITVLMMLTCSKGHTWNYRGSSDRACCSVCRSSVTVRRKVPRGTLDENAPPNGSAAKGKEIPEISAPDKRKEVPAEPESRESSGRLVARDDSPRPVVSPIQKHVEAKEQSNDSQVRENEDARLERIIASSPNPVQALEAYGRLQYRRQIIKFIDSPEFSKMTTRERLRFCEEMGFSDTAQYYRKKLWEEQLANDANMVLSMSAIKAQGGRLDPVVEYTICLAIAAGAKQRQRELDESG